MDDLGYLRVYGNGQVPVLDIKLFLSSLEKSYNALCLLDYFISGVIQINPKRNKHLNKKLTKSRIKNKKSIFHKLFINLNEDRLLIDPTKNIFQEHQLILSEVELHSPGFWEFVGRINPLEVIRVYLNDRHERKKDNLYRNNAEKEKLIIENNINHMKFIKEVINVAKEAGFSEQERRQLIFKGIEPLFDLDYIANSSTISSAESTNNEQDSELIDV